MLAVKTRRLGIMLAKCQFVSSEAFKYRRSLPAVRRAFERHKCWAIGDVFPYLGHGRSFQFTSIAAHDMPPQIFQAACGWINKFEICCGVDYDVTLDFHVKAHCELLLTYDATFL